MMLIIMLSQGGGALPLVVATRNCARVDGGAGSPEPLDAGVWGLLRVAREEFPGLSITAVDVPAELPVGRGLGLHQMNIWPTSSVSIIQGMRT